MQIGRRVQATEAPPLSPFMEKAARLRSAGRDPIILAQAMVDWPPPAGFTRSLRAALASPKSHLHHYAPDPGLPELRTMLAGYLRRAFDIRCDPEREILVTAGANHAAFVALSAILDPGDEVLIVSPWYFNHLMTLQLLGVQARGIEARPAEDWVPRIAELRAALTPRTRALILVNPSNPSGARYPDQWIAEWARVVARDRAWAGVWILADQTYQEIFYAGTHPRSLGSYAALRKQVITVGSFSKCFALAGWRVGFLVASAMLIEQVLKIQDSSVICAPRAAQWAIAQALEQTTASAGYFQELRAVLRSRRDALIAELRADQRLRVCIPGGSCFAMLGLPAGVDGGSFAHALLEECQVATIPGICFGAAWREYLRLSFGTEEEGRLAEAAGRIRGFLSTWLERDRQRGG